MSNQNNTKDKLNDIYSRKELYDFVNVSDLFYISKVRPKEKLKNNTTLDLKKNLKNIKLNKKPKIKIKKSKNIFKDIVIKKNTFIIIYNRLNKEINNAIVVNKLKEITDFWNQKFYFDIIPPKITFKKLLNNIFIKKIQKKIFKIKYYILNNIQNIIEYNNKKNNINFKKLIYFFLYFIRFFILYFIIIWYKLFNLINDTKILTNNLKEKNIDIQLIKSLKTDSKTLNIFLYPIYSFNHLINSNKINDTKFILKTYNNLLEATYLSLFFINETNNLIKKKGIENIYFTNLFFNSENLINDIYNKIISFLDSFEKIKNKDLLIKDKNILLMIEKNIPILKEKLNLIYQNKNLIYDILWHEKEKKYIIFLQNSDEIRPTWWFMWSAIELKIFRWNIKEFNFIDIYALEWKIKDFSKNEKWVAFTEPAPEWINKLTNTFWLRDANYFYDISKSSKKIVYFLEKAWIKVDWIIYINQNIILDFLKKLWWVYFPDFNIKIDEKNFSTVISLITESKITHTHTLWTPKKWLFDFANYFINDLKQKIKPIDFYRIISKSIIKNDIIIDFLDENKNSFKNNLINDNYYRFLDSYNFFYPIFTSISWNKSDRYIKRTFIFDIDENDNEYKIKANVNLNHKITINDIIYIKSLIYDLNLLWKIDENTLLKIAWNDNNKQYVRILIPKNSLVIEKEWLQIKEFNNYKEISFYIETKPYSKSNFDFEYIIKKQNIPNSFYFKKQPWIKDYNIKILKNWNLIKDLYTEFDYETQF